MTVDDAALHVVSLLYLIPWSTALCHTAALAVPDIVQRALTSRQLASTGSTWLAVVEVCVPRAEVPVVVVYPGRASSPISVPVIASRMRRTASSGARLPIRRVLVVELTQGVVERVVLVALARAGGTTLRSTSVID